MQRGTCKYRLGVFGQQIRQTLYPVIKTALMFITDVSVIETMFVEIKFWNRVISTALGISCTETKHPKHIIIISAS